MNQKKRWVLNNVIKATDGLGKQIDKGILKLVVLLNYHGLLTTMSCYGHKNRGHNYPWIDFNKEYVSGLTEIIKEFNLILTDNHRLEPKTKRGLFSDRKEFNKLKQKLKRLPRINKYSGFIK